MTRDISRRRRRIIFSFFLFFFFSGGECIISVKAPKDRVVGGKKGLGLDRINGMISLV